MSETDGSGGWTDQARAWCQGRYWQWRLPLLAYLAFSASSGIRDPDGGNWWSGITLAFHEMGHILFSPLGEFMAVAGGSITQVAIPIVAAWMFKRQGEWFGIAVAGCWLGSSLVDLARYIGDARAQELPLVGFSDDPMHDWHYLLGQLGWLRHDTQIAWLMEGVAVIVLGASLAFGLWLGLEMWRGRGEATGSRVQGPGSAK